MYAIAYIIKQKKAPSFDRAKKLIKKLIHQLLCISSNCVLLHTEDNGTHRQWD